MLGYSNQMITPIILGNNFKMKLEHIRRENVDYYQDSKGLRQGEFKVRWNNGKLWLHCFYKDGKLNGEYKRWEKNGQLYQHCFYENGKLEGEYKKWYGYTSGKLKEYGFYKNGKEVTKEELLKLKIQKILK